MSDNDLDKIAEVHEREYNQALNSTPVLRKRRAGRNDALVDRLASYCKNRAHCRRELAALLPLYGPQLEEFITRAISLSERPIDELVMLLAKHSMGEATDEDIVDFLERRKNIADFAARRPAARSPARPMRAPKLGSALSKIRSKITKIIFLKQIIRR